MITDPTERRYQDGSYLEQNPDWDRADSVWKARLVVEILDEAGLAPLSICDVGCGAGDVLATLRKSYPDSELTGFDISSDASEFWKNHEGQGIRFHRADFLSLDRRDFDCLLLLDVIEHLANPFVFLEAIRPRAQYFVLHIPLDLSAFTVLRESPLLRQRETVGHVHYFTKGLAVALLRECGFDVLRWRYTNAYVSGPSQTIRSRLALLPRYLAYSISKDVGVRLFGGETMIVLARASCSG